MELMININDPVLNGQLIAEKAVIDMHGMKYVVCDMKNPITVVAIWDEDPEVVYNNWVLDLELEIFKMNYEAQLQAEQQWLNDQVRRPDLGWKPSEVNPKAERASIQLPNNWSLSLMRGPGSYGRIEDANVEIGIIDPYDRLTGVAEFVVEETTYATEDGVLAWVSIFDVDAIAEHIGKL